MSLHPQNNNENDDDELDVAVCTQQSELCASQAEVGVVRERERDDAMSVLTSASEGMRARRPRAPRALRTGKPAPPGSSTSDRNGDGSAVGYTHGSLGSLAL